MSDFKTTQRLIQNLKLEKNEISAGFAPETPDENALKCIKILQKTIDDLTWFQAEMVADIMQKAKKRGCYADKSDFTKSLAKNKNQA